jgi:hypothetical protein
MSRIEDVSLAVIVAGNLATYALVWMTFPSPRWWLAGTAGLLLTGIDNGCWW